MAAMYGNASTCDSLVSSVRCHFFDLVVDYCLKRTLKCMTLHGCLWQVSRGADIECRDVNLMSPLMWAASEGHADVVKVLMKAGF